MRTLTPLGWGVGLAVAGLIAATALGGLGFRWDPLNLQTRRLEAAEARAAAGEAQGQARLFETEGAADQLRRLDDLHQQYTVVAAVSARAVEQARSADDSFTPLDADRADRLRRHDRELCRLAPDLAGCAATADPA